MDTSQVVAASREVDSQLKCRAQRLAGMLHKLHFPEEETATDLLKDVMDAHPIPAVALLTLFREALETRGCPVEQRLTALLPLLDMQLAATAADKQQQQQQQQLFTQADLSKGLLAAVSLLPEWYEDTPKAPVLVAECIGHFMAAGQVSFGLDQLVSAVTAAGVQKATGEEREEEEEAPLIEEEKAAPMVLTVLDLIKVQCGEAAAKAAWAAADVDLLSLMPSFANSPEDVQKLLQRYRAQYLML